jgi:hypothetical protein
MLAWAEVAPFETLTRYPVGVKDVAATSRPPKEIIRPNVIRRPAIVAVVFKTHPR